MKRFLSLLTALAIVFGTIAMTGAYAGSSVNDDAFRISITADKSDYGVFENPNISVSITNISEYAGSDIVVQILSDDYYLAGGESAAVISVNPGESVNKLYTVQLSSGANVGFFQKIILFFRNLFSSCRTISTPVSSDIIQSKAININQAGIKTEVRINLYYYFKEIITYKTETKYGVTVTRGSDGSFSIDRSGYVASYNELLPAAKENMQTYADYINEVLSLVNQMRAEKGIDPLQLSETLCVQACVRAEEVAWSGKHSHERPNHKSYTSLFIENGITTGIAGENLGWYYKTPAEICAAWKDSPEHYENIINPDFKYIGIGISPDPVPGKDLTWVQHFWG